MKPVAEVLEAIGRITPGTSRTSVSRVILHFYARTRACAVAKVRAFGE